MYFPHRFSPHTSPGPLSRVMDIKSGIKTLSYIRFMLGQQTKVTFNSFISFLLIILFPSLISLFQFFPCRLLTLAELRLLRCTHQRVGIIFPAISAKENSEHAMSLWLKWTHLLLLTGVKSVADISLNPNPGIISPFFCSFLLFPLFHHYY